MSPTASPFLLVQKRLDKRHAYGLCPQESRPRGETLHAVGRSADNLWSPLDFVSGYGLVSAPFRVRPTSTPLPSRLRRHPERGNETAQKPTAATRELVARSPHNAFPVERPILYCLSLAWENRKGGTPFARFFPLFLAGTRNRAAGGIPERPLQTPI